MTLHATNILLNCQHPFGSFLFTKVDKIAEMKLNGVNQKFFFIYLVLKFWQILTRNLAKLVKFTPRKAPKKKSPNFWVKLWQNFIVKKKNHWCGSKKLHLSSYQYKTMIMVGTQKIYLKAPNFFGSMSFMFLITFKIIPIF